MGLFSRNESASRPERRSASRSAMSSEAQAGEMRSRARRRLIGALVLVLAAVIVVPMLFESPEHVSEPVTPVVVPAIVPPSTDPGQIASNTPQGGAPGSYSGAIQQPDSDAASSGDASQGQAATAEPPADTSQALEPEATPETKPEPKPAPKPEPKPEPKPKPSAKPDKVERTDDGSVALALLEGRTPPAKVAAPEKGNYILQIAAYTTEADARSRRDKLSAAGVTNAYVENASSGGKTTYRLRVGPFPSRDAAQAAQARLRALGYDNGFISTK